MLKKYKVCESAGPMVAGTVNPGAGLFITAQDDSPAVKEALKAGHIRLPKSEASDAAAPSDPKAEKEAADKAAADAQALAEKEAADKKSAK